VSWNAAEPPPPPPATLASRLRLLWRAPAAGVWLAAMFALFLVARAFDRLAGTSLGAAVIRAWAGGALAILGLRLHVVGSPMAGEGAIVANHASWLDIVALMRAAPGVHFVSKAEVSGWPGIGAIGRAIGTVFIERRPTEARRQGEALHARLAAGDRLVIFPEGTSTDGSRVLPFKSALFGVFLAPDLADRLAVQPASIRYRPAPGLPSDLYGWWGDMDFGAHLLTLLAHSRRGEVSVRFLPPLVPGAHPGRKALADAAAEAVTAGFDLD
jgi:1-acyl-sn-glycerol-3-phosphate acyltransferase